MITIHILYPNFLDVDKGEVYIGGIQNYIKSLNDVLIADGFQVEVYQLGSRTEHRLTEKISVNTYASKFGNTARGIKDMFHFFSKKFNENDIIIWGTDTIGFKSKFKNVIAIQHGITFDLMYYNKLNSIWRKNYLGIVYKKLQCYKARKNFRKYDYIVCVDYNYLNWIRTQLPRNITDRAVVIPNYGTVQADETVYDKAQRSFNILFARRFSFERGAEIMLEMIPLILNKYPNVRFTLCGDGPYKSEFERAFRDSENVTITKFKVGEAIEFNLNHCITLIPTYGSEGTSFSLLEGMGCGSIPIVSNVGGMTNIVIDGYNGFLVNPNANAFKEAIEKVLMMTEEERNYLSKNAMSTVELGFSKKIWEEKWRNYIKMFYQR